MKAAIAVCLAALVLFAPRFARADVTPPDAEACQNKEVGAACSFDGSSGTCQDSTCTGLDYSNRDDAGMPGTREYACRKCILTGRTGSDAGVSEDAGAASNSGSSDQSDKSSGCSSIAGGGVGGELGALLIAGSFSLLFLLKRRRKA